MATTNDIDLYAEVHKAFITLTKEFVSHSPRIIGALLVLIAGILFAKLVSKATKKIIQSIELVFTKYGRKTSQPLKKKWVDMFAVIIQWSLILFFLFVSTNILGWNIFNNWVSTIIKYLPNLIAGIFIILSGFLLGNLAKTAFSSTSKAIDTHRTEMLSIIIYYITVVTAIIIGIEQIGINIHFLTNLVTILFGALLISFTFSFTLGAKALIANFIGAQYARKKCNIGAILSIKGIKGRVLEVGQTSITINTEGEIVMVPARFFQEEISRFEKEDNNG